MYICYLDEAGCTGALPTADSAIQPVFVLGGLIVKQNRIKSITDSLLQLKRKYYPNHLPAGSLYHDWMQAEIKGSSLRNQARSTGRNNRRFAYSVISSALNILSENEVKLIARVYIKAPGSDFNSSSVYTSAVQAICSGFQAFLTQQQSSGLVIADGRNKGKNANVSHSIFTQRYRAGGDPYASLVEVPTFGHSENHAALQLMDFVCSGLLFPIASQICCSSYLTDSTHLSPHYLNLKTRYGQKIKDLQFRYQETNKWLGGITLIDPVNKMNAAAIL